VRYRARLVLERLLSVLLPLTVADSIRHRYVGGGTVSRALLAPVIAACRHRPIAALGTFTLPDDPSVTLAAVESRFVRRLYWYGVGGYEGAEAEWWVRCCARATNVLELGANVGFYSVIGGRAAPDARYRAVEPHPQAVDIARRNLALNGVDNVEIIPAAAVGHKTAVTVSLSLPDEERYVAPTGAFLDGADGTDHLPAGDKVDVPVVSMVDLVDGVDLMKLDIEGLEAETLGSVLPWIVEQRPTIVLEVRPRARRLRPVIRDLHDADFVVYAIGATSLHLVTAEQIRSPEPLPRYGSRDVILVPAERAGSL
jgi:FkbM family methyltransferase